MKKYATPEYKVMQWNTADILTTSSFEHMVEGHGDIIDWENGN